jgi:hypothetical protein
MPNIAIKLATNAAVKAGHKGNLQELDKELQPLKPKNKTPQAETWGV